MSILKGQLNAIQKLGREGQRHSNRKTVYWETTDKGADALIVIDKQGAKAIMTTNKKEQEQIKDLFEASEFADGDSRFYKIFEKCCTRETDYHLFVASATVSLFFAASATASLWDTPLVFERKVLTEKVKSLKAKYNLHKRPFTLVLQNDVDGRELMAVNAHHLDSMLNCMGKNARVYYNVNSDGPRSPLYFLSEDNSLQGLVLPVMYGNTLRSFCLSRCPEYRWNCYDKKIFDENDFVFPVHFR